MHSIIAACVQSIIDKKKNAARTHALHKCCTHAHSTYSVGSYVRLPQVPGYVNTGRPKLCAEAIAASSHPAMPSIEIPLRQEKLLPVMVAWSQPSIISV